MSERTKEILEEMRHAVTAKKDGLPKHILAELILEDDPYRDQILGEK